MGTTTLSMHAIIVCIVVAGSAGAVQGKQDGALATVSSAAEPKVEYSIALPDKSFALTVIDDNTRGGVLLEQVSPKEIVLLFPLRRDLPDGSIVVRGFSAGQGLPIDIPAENVRKAGVAGVHLHLDEIASFLRVEITYQPAQGEQIKLLSLRGQLTSGEPKPIGPPTLRFECQSTEGCTLTLFTSDETGQILETPIPMTHHQVLYSTGALGITCPGCTVSVV